MFEKPSELRILISPDGKIKKTFIISGKGSSGKTRAEYNAFVNDKNNKDWKEKTVIVKE